MQKNKFFKIILGIIMVPIICYIVFYLIFAIQVTKVCMKTVATIDSSANVITYNENDYYFLSETHDLEFFINKSLGKIKGTGWEICTLVEDEEEKYLLVRNAVENVGIYGIDKNFKFEADTVSMIIRGEGDHIYCIKDKDELLKTTKAIEELSNTQMYSWDELQPNITKIWDITLFFNDMPITKKENVHTILCVENNNREEYFISFLTENGYKYFWKFIGDKNSMEEIYRKMP